MSWSLPNTTLLGKLFQLLHFASDALQRRFGSSGAHLDKVFFCIVDTQLAGLRKGKKNYNKINNESKPYQWNRIVFMTHVGYDMGVITAWRNAPEVDVIAMWRPERRPGSIFSGTLDLGNGSSVSFMYGKVYNLAESMVPIDNRGQL